MMIGRSDEPVENHLLLLNPCALTNEVHQSLFSKAAAQKFLSTLGPRYANMGIIPESYVHKLLPEHITKECLIQLQYCQEFSHSEVGVDYTVTPNASESKENLLYFPALCNLESRCANWSQSGDPDHTFRIGWYTKCKESFDYFPTRFLHVVLLRLAFTLALPSVSESSMAQAYSRRCTMWKNGIHWLMEEEVKCIFEMVDDNKGIVVITKAEECCDELYTTLRKIVNTVMQAKSEFCNTVLMRHFLLDSDDPQSFKDGDKLFEINDIERVIRRGKKSVISVSGQESIKSSDSRLLMLKNFSYWGLTEEQLDSEDVQSPPDPEGEVAVGKEKTVELTTQQKLNQVLDHDSSGVSKHLGQIADSMHEWDGRLAEELSLTRADIAVIKMKYPNDLKQQTREALEMWKQAHGSEATYINLIGVFQRAGYQEYADMVYKIGTFSDKYVSPSPTNIDRERSPDLSNSPIPLTSLTFLDCWKCGETTVLVTNSGKDTSFSWANYGLNLHIMSHSLPPGIPSCTIHIIATVIGNYEIPANSHLVSPVFWLQCRPQCKFIKPITLEIQHCAKQNNSDKVRLYFVRANATQEQPYTFVKADGSSQTEHGIFPTQCTYGFIQLESFSGYGIVQEDSEERDYCANLYYIGQEESQCQVHFAVSWNTETHRSAVNDHYSKKGSESAADQQIEFESDRITLDIPITGVITENKGWKIIPLFSPVIFKKEVDRFDVGKRIPTCQMQATATPSTILTDLHHIINLIGAKDPFNVFTLYRHSYKESNSVRIEWGEKRVQRPLQFAPRTEGSTSASATDISCSKTRKSSGFMGKLGSRVHDKPESGLSMSSSINFSSMATKLASTLVLSSTQKDILVSTSTVTDSYASLNYDLRVNTTDHEDVSTAAHQDPSALCQDKIETSSPKPPQLVVLLRELTDEVSARWEDIGLYLDLKPGELEIIKKDNPRDSKACLREMLKLWMKQVEPGPSWSAIITAIKSCGYHSLARKLKQTYLPAVTIEML